MYIVQCTQSRLSKPCFWNSLIPCIWAKTLQVWSSENLYHATALPCTNMIFGIMFGIFNVEIIQIYTYECNYWIAFPNKNVCSSMWMTAYLKYPITWKSKCIHCKLILMLSTEHRLQKRETRKNIENAMKFTIKNGNKKNYMRFRFFFLAHSTNIFTSALFEHQWPICIIPLASHFFPLCSVLWFCKRYFAMENCVFCIQMS